MNQDYIEKWSELVKNAQQPLQEFAQLQAKTVQSLSYVKPNELSELKNPQALLEKNVEIMVENGHKLLDYMQESFQLFEKSMKQAIKETKKASAAVKK